MSESNPQKSLARRLLLFAAVFVALLGGLVVWIWNGPAAAPQKPVPAFVVERQPDGSWPPVETGEPGFRIAFGATERKATTNTSSSKGVTAQQGARFASRSLLVTTSSEVPLEHAIATRIVGALQQDDYVRQIRYRRRGGDVPVGVARPDLVVDVELQKVGDEMAFGSGALEAAVVVHVGSLMCRTSMHTSEVRSAPPVVNLHMEITAETSMDQSGFATPNLVFDTVANELAGAVTKHLTEEFAGMREEYGVQPYLPPAFAVEHVPVDEAFDVSQLVPESATPQLLASWCGPLLHNETWWSARVEGEPQAVLEWVEAAMAEQGYESRNSHTRLRRSFRKGDVRVDVDAPPPRQSVGISFRAGEQKAEPEFVDLTVRYRQDADKPRVAAAMKSVLGDGVAPEVLLACLSRLEGEDRERGLARVGALQLSEPSLLIQRARARHGAGEVEGVADDLLRAKMFAELSFNRQAQAEKVEDAAKSMKVALADRSIDPGWLRANGFHEIVDGADPIEAVATASEPVRCFVLTDDPKLHKGPWLFAIGLDASDNTDQWLGSIRVIDNGFTSSSGSGGAGPRRYDTAFGKTIHYEFLDSTDDARAEVRVSVR